MPGIIGPQGPAVSGGSTLEGTPAVDFANQVAKQTGLDPRVVYAWEQAEGAYAPGGTGGYNYLNLRPYPGDPYSSVSSGGFEQFSTLKDAVTATVRRIKQPFAAPIMQSAGQSPAQQIAAIASTGWDASHYGGPGGPNLLADFQQLYGSSAAGKASSTPLPGAGGGQSAGQTSAGAFLSPLTGWIGDLLSILKAYAIRVAEVVGGGLLILAGLFLATGRGVPSPLGALG